MRRQKAKTYQKVLNNYTPKRVECAFLFICVHVGVKSFYFILLIAGS